MGQTLTNGIYLPDEGERNSYSGLEANWRTLDALILTVNGKAAPNVANTWTAEQTFTAGIIGDLTGNVTGNVTGNLTGTAAKAIADEDGTSIKTGYVNVAGNQTVTGQKTWSALNGFTKGIWLDGAREAYIFPESAASYSGLVFTTQSYMQSFKFGDWQTSNNDVSFNSNNAYLSISAGFYSTDSKNKINIEPRKADESTLGSSSYQWSSVYAQSYYYNGTAWGLDKANVWSQNQSVVNAVTPKFILQDTRNDRTYSASATLSGGVMRWECDDKDGAPLSRISTTLRSDKVVQLQFAIFNEDSSGSEFDRTIRFAVGNTGSAVYYPEQTGNVDLGDSSHKWKTLNGVNPGALSLPDNSKSVTIDTTNWDVAGGTNVYTPPANGWLHIRVTGATELTVKWTDWRFGDRRVSATATDLGVTIPVVAGVTVDVVTVASSFNGKCQFFPCLGNV